MNLVWHETEQIPRQHLRKEPAGGSPCGPSAPQGMRAADHKWAPPLQEQQTEKLYALILGSSSFLIFLHY